MRSHAGKPGPFAAAVLAASAFALAPAQADRYVRIDDHVAIGGQPTPAQLAGLAEAGFRSILNLREESEFNTQPERLAAAAVGLAYRSVPVSSANPTDAAVEEFLRVADDPDLYPVLIHCASGNRAAALWMIRRVLCDGRSLLDAQAEADRAGLKSAAMREFALEYIGRHGYGEMPSIPVAAARSGG
jgi:uncharacterized protein (TIGR01244 family)